MNLRNTIISLFRKRTPVPDHDALMRSFRLQYTHFKDLLLSNAELGSLMAEMDEKLYGAGLFGMNEVRALATRTVFHALRMVTALNAISQNRYPQLPDMVEHINARISGVLDTRTPLKTTSFTLPFTEITKDTVDIVGGKCANLGEIRNKVGLPTTAGFAVTTAAFETFLDTEDLRFEIQKQLRETRPDDPQSVLAASRSISATIARHHVPTPIMDAMDAAWDEHFTHPDTCRAALRSSAVSEDGALSFSGQYRTVLGVTRQTLSAAFREVLASLFSPRAITYRIHHGVSFEHCAMGMACIEMIEAVSSGIVFSRHPVNPLSDEMVVNAVFGLGSYAVDGIIEPDTWHVSPSNPPLITARHIAIKPVRLVVDETGKHEASVPVGMQSQPSLTDSQLAVLADMAASLERHYHHPQDVEWAVSPDGRIHILQSRPMRLASSHQEGSVSPLPGQQLLVSGGDIACSGYACGTAVQASELADLSDFPENGVLIARHSLPNYALVMNRARAIVTEAGSITGHMASLAREFRVPTILNVRNALSGIPHGLTVTVDAVTARVYAGEVGELLRLADTRRFTIADSPIHAILRQVADNIIPLHLLDPKSSLFRPESCTTIHDIMRFVHERCYEEMFRISDRASDAGSVSLRLRVKLPMDLHIIDLGAGLQDIDGPYVSPDQILCTPLRALLGGMLRPEVHMRGPRPVDMGGFLAVMGRHLLDPPETRTERFGERSYAIISDKYMNFSSRVGYHYCVVDAYCGQTLSKNYISFQFKGGAADEIRRERRVRCIALILDRLGFTTEVRADMTQAKFQKYPADESMERLDQLGRLLIVTRQMDMLMTHEEAVTAMADKFMAEQYH